VGGRPLNYALDVTRMPSRSEIERRKLLKGAVDRQRLSAEAAALPLPMTVLQLLFDYLDDRSDEGCDHTFKVTREFLQESRLPEADVLPWLRAHGGHCDCEVLANVEQHCEELISKGAV
jgi:hypothetical protein